MFTKFLTPDYLLLAINFLPPELLYCAKFSLSVRPTTYSLSFQEQDHWAGSYSKALSVRRKTSSTNFRLQDLLVILGATE